jgi:hypothetical protein
MGAAYILLYDFDNNYTFAQVKKAYMAIQNGLYVYLLISLSLWYAYDYI